MVFPTAIVTPSRNGSVFEALIRMYIMDVLVMLSTVMSCGPRCQVGSKVVSPGQQISPDRRKPKKHRFIAAHSMIASRSEGC